LYFLLGWLLVDGIFGGSSMLELPTQKSPVRTRARNKQFLLLHSSDPENIAAAFDDLAKYQPLPYSSTKQISLDCLSTG